MFIEEISIAKNILQDIKKETINYTILKEVMQYIENGWSKYKNQLRKSLQEYWKLKSELTSCVDGIVIKNERIVFPEVLQSENLRYLHIGHFRIEETKARTVVY